MNDNAHVTPGFGASAQLGGQPQQLLRLLRLADVMDRVAMGKSTIYALVARNEFIGISAGPIPAAGFRSHSPSAIANAKTPPIF